MSDIKEVARQVMEGITPGPWRFTRSTSGIEGGPNGYDEVITAGPVQCMSYCYGGTSTIEGDNLDNDARFIAAARQLVPDLLAALEHAEYQRDSWMRIAQTRQENLERLAIEKRTAVANVEYWHGKATGS